jgi:murein tripeptide amidase MpaA
MHFDFARAFPTSFVMLLIFAAMQTVGVQDGTNFPDELLTVAEATDYEATSLSSDVNRFLQTCDERADHVRQFEVGRTTLDQPLVGAIFASPMVDAPPTDGRLTVMLLGNIHTGECDGKEALLMLARELTLNARHPWLKKLVIVMVPNYNADGNDKVALDNRPGQIGPIRGMGTRETAEGLDLNRDFMKLETSEAKALVRLIDRWGER